MKAKKSLLLFKYPRLLSPKAFQRGGGYLEWIERYVKYSELSQNSQSTGT